MTPQQLLECYDGARLWPVALSDAAGFDVDRAYQQALAVRALRIARGEQLLQLWNASRHFFY